MADVQLAPHGPLDTRLTPRRIGRSGEDGVTVCAREGLSLALITARRGMRAACIEKLRTSFDLQAPDTARIVQGRGLSLAWAGPDAWLAIAGARPDLETELRALLRTAASIVDHSDQRIVLRLSGPAAREVLAKGVVIDLHPRAFTPGDTAITSLAHVTAQLWQVDDRPTFDLAIPRATARDVFHWLTASAAEFGLEITAAQD